MANDSLTGLPQGFPTPNRHVEHTIHDTNILPPNVAWVRFAVSAAGNVVCVMADGTEVTYNFPAAGVYVERGGFAIIKATAATATLAPATKVVVGYLV